MKNTILSDEEIRTFRQYVERKHSGDAASLRAAVLTDALHRVLEQRLPAFPEDVRRQLGRDLLASAEGGAEIRADDALRRCLALPLEQETLLRPLVSWSCERAALSEKESAVRDTLLHWSRSSPAPHAADMQSLRLEAERRHVSASAGSRRGGRGLLRRTGAVAAAGLLALAGSLALSGLIDAPDAALPPVPAASASAETAPETAREAPPAERATRDYRYADVDAERLRTYLADRDSALAAEPYFSAIVGAAEKHDVHPLLLFAITGQEQGFVPTTHEHAERIASNPFNVFGSWEAYNTDIDDAASLAAKLVAKRLADRPEEADPIQWINRTYAEDPNWWKGVSWFFDDMERNIFLLREAP